MRFIANSTTMLKALAKCAGVIGSNTIVSVLEDFLFELSGNVLTISATDLETTIKVRVEVGEAEGDGAICIPAKKLQEYLKTLTEQPVTFKIELRELSLTLSTSTGKSRIGCEKSDDFPKAIEPIEATSFKLPALLLGEAIERTLFAVSSDTLRPAMTGLLFNLGTDAIVFASTDGHRLVEYRLELLSAPAAAKIVVPKKALQQLRGLLPADDSELAITYNANHLFIETGAVAVTARLIDQTFPDYKAIIPRDNPYTLTVNRADFVAAVKRVGIFANKTTEQIVLTIEGNTLQIQAADIDFGYEAVETIPAEWSGDRFQIAFNGRLLAEMATNTGGDQISIQLSTATRAGLMSPAEQSEGEHLQSLLMPLQVGI